ncbi:MAG: hypothetical protein KA780_04880 [Prolixibacteraceae bacterium]|nr:hypothetical protein [Prolixibacteraceae bacterium]
MKGKMISGLLLLIFLAAPCRVVPQIKFDLKKKIERKAEKEADEKNKPHGKRSSAELAELITSVSRNIPNELNILTR